jgi:DNA-binding MarR family transcriptional regulator
MSLWPSGQSARVCAILACMQATVDKREVSTKRAVEDDLAGHLYGFVKYVLHAHGDDYVKAVGELELSLTQLRALHLLVDDVEEASLKDLADRLELSLPAVSRAIDNLVQRELVTRTEDAEDRRMKRVRATREAAIVLDRLNALRLAGVEEFVATLAPRERARLAAALAPLAEREEIAMRCPRGRRKLRSSGREDAA